MTMNHVKATFTAIGALLSSLLGILYIPVLLMVTANVIDYATGLIASPYRKENIKSYKAFKGVAKKIGMWLLVVVGAIVDQLIAYAADTVGVKMPFSFLVACIVCIWIVCNEIISILENLIDIGVAIPPFLLPIVKLIQKQTEEAGKVGGEDGSNGNGQEDLH